MKFQSGRQLKFGRENEVAVPMTSPASVTTIDQVKVGKLLWHPNEPF